MGALWLFRLSRYIKHSRQCFIGYPNTSNFVKNPPLRVVFSTLFSVFGNPDETLSSLIYFFSSDVTPKEPTISPITKFHKRSQIVSSVMPSLCKVLLTRNNVKNDVKKDSPI